MIPSPPAAPGRKRLFGVLAVLLVVLAAGLGYWTLKSTPDTRTDPPPPAAATAGQVRQVCGACHPYPPPDTLPRSAWRKEVKQGYDFLHKDPRLRFDFPSLEGVVRYYEDRAPDELPPLPRAGAASPRTRPTTT